MFERSIAMKPLHTLRVFAAGFGAALIASWVATQVEAQQPIKSPDTSIRVCVAKDGVMRLAGPASCPPGQKPLDLKIPDDPSPDSPDDTNKDDKDDAKTCAEAQQKVNELAERLGAIEKS